MHIATLTYIPPTELSVNPLYNERMHTAANICQFDIYIRRRKTIKSSHHGIQTVTQL